MAKSKSRSQPKSAAKREEPLRMAEALSPFKATEWMRLTPGERLRRSWALRSRIPNLQAIHDQKLFPKP